MEEDEPLITNVIQVTGTIEQLNELNEFLVTSGIIVKLVEDEQEYMEDDLAWANEDEWPF